MNRLKLSRLRAVLPSLLPLYEQRSLYSLRSLSLIGSTNLWSGVPLSGQGAQLQPPHHSHPFGTHARQHAQRKPYRHPGILTKEIKEARQAAVRRVRSASSGSVTGIAGQFSRRMLKLCEPDLDYIQVSAMMHSTATVWETSDAALTSDLQQQQQGRQDAQRCLEQILPRLEAMLNRVGARQASNTLWSFAKVGLDPDAVCPGITAGLLHKVAESTKSANAQEMANSVWAMAVLQDVRKASDAEKSVTRRLCSHFMRYVHDPCERGSATAQNVCSVLQGIVALELQVKPSTIDKFLAYLVKVVQRAPAQVVAQNIYNALIYCYKLRYMPQHAVASALLAHFVSLFPVLDKEPNTRGMSNTVLAVAGLGVPHVAQEVRSIAIRVVNGPGVNCQDLCNLAWSKALLNILDLKGFDQILDILEVQMNNVVGIEGVSQLHQAHCHLEPLFKNSEEHSAWDAVKDKLEKRVGPALKAEKHTGSDALLSVVESLGLRHRRHMQLSMYMADAVLKRTDDPERAAVLLVAESEWAYLVNHPDRLKGSAEFRHKLLAKHGQVVAIPYYKLSREGVKAELEAAIGVPLHQAFQMRTSLSASVRSHQPQSYKHPSSVPANQVMHATDRPSEELTAAKAPQGQGGAPGN